MALGRLHNLRVEVLFDYVTKFNLSDKVDDSFFLEMAQKHIAERRYHEGSLIISKFKFFDQFNVQDIAEHLVD